MTKNESNDSVQNEQFGGAENTQETNLSETQKQEETQEDINSEVGEDKTEDTVTSETESAAESDIIEIPQEDNTEVKEDDTPDLESSSEDTEAAVKEDEEVETVKADDSESYNEEAVLESEEPVQVKTEEEMSEPEVSETSNGEVPKEDDVESKDEGKAEAESSSEDIGAAVTEEAKAETEKADDSESDNATEPSTPKYVSEQIDFTKLSKEDLVKVLKDLLATSYVNEIRGDVEQIKTNFYKKHKAKIEEKKEKFLSEGGAEQDFKVEESPLEKQLKELLNQYKNLRYELGKKLESEKENNVKLKYEIIDKIKDLVNSQESLNKTFHEFRELQNQWREVGPVPQQTIKDLWDSYHYHVEGFYDYIKINKELRDLDFKKNFEAKIKLCEQTEELLLEPSIVEAFRRLQKLHEQWREVGPIPVDKRSEMWDRFKEATTKINKKHQEYFVQLKQDQKKNYEEKLVLCEKAEEIAEVSPENYSEWDKKSRELVELQKVWKTIGFAPKKYNTQVYERFRKACDSFFNKKREFYSQNREEQQNNYQLKTELCIQAEALQDSTDWKKTTSDYIALQKKWKEIGPVSSKQSEKIWKRFRAACDTFFNNKSNFYSNIDSTYEDNLNKKTKLIEEIQNFAFSDDVEKNLNALKDYQRQWSEIGYVPIKNKEEIQDRYRAAINEKFDKLKLDDDRKGLIKFRSRLEGINSKPNANHRLHMEREKCFSKLKQLENDIILWENNIGFFANTQNAESMIRDVNKKVEDAKNRIEQLKSRIRILDEFES